MLKHVRGQILVLQLVCLVDTKVIQDWSIEKLQRKFKDTYKEQRITCLLIENLIILR